VFRNTRNVGLYVYVDVHLSWKLQMYADRTAG
jgi:hypothetical protein